MPSAITHQLIAEEAVRLLPDGLQHIIERAPDEYYLGCQGPDMFFFYRIGCRSEYNLGKFLHRHKVYEVFRLFARLLSGEQNADLPRFSEEDRTRIFAYILGYLAHYAADSTFHPFVYNYMAKEGSAKPIHQLIENDWDVHFLHKFRGREAEKFRCAFSPKKSGGKRRRRPPLRLPCRGTRAGGSKKEQIQRRAQELLALSRLLPRKVLFRTAQMGQDGALLSDKALSLLPLPAQAPRPRISGAGRLFRALRRQGRERGRAVCPRPR